jgi:hypothetical protein
MLYRLDKLSMRTMMQSVAVGMTPGRVATSDQRPESCLVWSVSAVTAWHASCIVAVSTMEHAFDLGRGKGPRVDEDSTAQGKRVADA